MARSFLLSAVLAVTLAVSGFAQRGPGRMAPPPGPGRGMALIERWSKMPPEQRERALSKLDPERRRRIEEQLNWYQNLRPEERDQLRFRADMFNRLPPDRQDVARRLFRQYNQLPLERQNIVRDEFNSLREMSPRDRRARIESSEFQEKFNPREQQFLRQFSRLLNPGPMNRPPVSGR